MIQNGKEKLNIWANGKQTIIDSPIKPYFYSYKILDIPKAIRSERKAIALSNFQEHLFYKYEFNTRKELEKARDEIREKQGRGITFEDNIPFVLRNRIDNPDLFIQYPHTNPFIFLHLDIEQYMKLGRRAPSEDDRITAISFCTNDRIIKSASLKKDSLSDNKLIVVFIDEYKKINPDIICLYNKSYDMPTIFTRCKKNEIDLVPFSKNGTRPSIGGKDGVMIDGVVIYDLYDSADDDQSLTGNIPDKGLKSVSDHFEFKTNIKVLTIDEMRDKIGEKELIDYNKDDVRRLLCLFDVYYETVSYKSDDLKIPFNESTSLSTTNLGIIVIGDLFREHNIIADGDNYSRYPEIFQRKKKADESNYQGALIEIRKIGLFLKVRKADYGSLYPTIQAEFNFSPDVMTLLMYEPYGKFSIEEHENWFIYHIPDNVLNKNIVIQVLKKEGFYKKPIMRFLNERSVFKKDYKKTGSKVSEAKSNISKVKANGGIYGNQGAAHHPFGFAPIAIATCGIGRECAQLLIDVLQELYGKCTIETDSITGDTPIFIRDKITNEIDIVPIQDLSDGSLRTVISNYETLTRNLWKDLQYVYCHEVEKEIYTVDMAQSRVDVTGDHSVFSKGKKVQANQLKIGNELDILPAWDYGGKNKEINEDHAWLLGFFIAEGSIFKYKPKKTVFINKDGSPRKLRKVNHYALSINQKTTPFLNKCSKILEKEYGLKCYLYDTLKSSSVYKLECWGEQIEKIMMMCYCKDLKTKKVPKQILNAYSKVIVRSFLQGLLDGDGHRYITQNRRVKESICSKSKPLASGIAYLYDRMNKTYNVNCRTDKFNITAITTHATSIREHHPGRITKIMKSEKCLKKVYDLGTENGNFIAGVGRVICHNTDGIYFTAENFDEEKTIKLFNEKFEQKFKRRLDLIVDFEEYDKGYFYRMKNYILEKKGKLILHGVAMKSSRKCNIINKLIHAIARAKLDGQDEKPIIRQFKQLKFPIEDFAMSVTMGMNENEYKNQNGFVMTLVKQAEEQFGIKPRAGNRYSYVKTKSGYKLAELATLNDIDMDYYQQEIIKVEEIFKIEHVSSSVDKWMTKK